MKTDTARPRQGPNSEGRRELSWPAPNTVYLTLDLECDFGTALAKNTYEAVDHVDKLVALLETTDAPLTCFVQTELLDKRPDAVETLRNCRTTIKFHPHSHTHSERAESSVRQEIETSTDRYFEYFGRWPEGYRFPNGNVRDTDYRLLAAQGYEFDASVFPTWRPGHFNNTGSTTVPTYIDRFEIFELPFTVASSLVPIPTGLSYCQVFGRPFVYYLTREPPSTVVFNFHVHDLVTPETVTELSPLYRAIYTRNDSGLSLLKELIETFRASGYSFDTLDTAHEQLRTSL